MICQKCGDVVFEGAVFCVRCGAMLAGTRAANRDATPPAPSNPWLKISAGILTAAAAIVVLVSLSLGRSSGPTVRYVPDVVGMSLADAQAKLAKAGFECAVGEERPSDTTDAGAVISQYPHQDTPTSRDHVTLVVSLGPDAKEPAGQSRQTSVPTKRPPTTTSARPAATPKSERPAQQRQVVESRPRARQTSTAAASSPAKPESSSGSGYGSVAIETQPEDWDVWVYVDGGPARGKCPITVRLPAGEHSLVLWEPSQQKRLAVPVTVEADQTVSVRRDLSA